VLFVRKSFVIKIVFVFLCREPAPVRPARDGAGAGGTE
jgi:hypothetical protein